MEHKLIFLDIDGTLTEPGKNEPPTSAVEAVRIARANGHRVVLCSGRSRGMLSPLLAYGFDGLVGSAGGYIEYGGQVIYDCPMTPEQQGQAMRVLADNGIFRTVEGKEHSYTDEGFKQFLRENAGAGGNSELLRWREQIEGELGIRPMAEYQGEPIYKIVFMCRRAEDLQGPMRVLGDSFGFCLQGTDQYGVINGELINKAFHKGTAVQRLSQYTGVPIEDTIAFGDSMNDLEMIQTAGLGICMGNGSEALKKIADEVCPPVGEDGLFRAFQSHGLI
ncbi:MAG: HAD family hydrolase [Clostridiales bacterium]|nr:HAD family hydrolase [Clostridiales bacterium]